MPFCFTFTSFDFHSLIAAGRAVCCPGRQVAVLWRELRGRLEALLAAKIASPDLDLWEAGEKLLGTVRGREEEGGGKGGTGTG